MTACLFVGLGGFVGAVCRYLLSLIPVSKTFPAMTLLTNLAGAVFIGVIVAFSEQITSISPNLLLFLKTGLCGGFTTFSTFSLETLVLFEQKRPLLGLSYILLSVLLCLAGVFLGKWTFHFFREGAPFFR